MQLEKLGYIAALMGLFPDTDWPDSLDQLFYLLSKIEEKECISYIDLFNCGVRLKFIFFS